MTVVGEQLAGNIRIRIRNVSWIQMKFSLALTLKPAVERRKMQRPAVGRSEFGFQFL
jgi:hypothetical protein